MLSNRLANSGTFGGAIALEQVSSAMVEECIFTTNKGSVGGALASLYNTGSVAITNSIFDNNECIGDSTFLTAGGAVLFHSFGGQGLVSNCVFS